MDSGFDRLNRETEVALLGAEEAKGRRLRTEMDSTVEREDSSIPSHHDAEALDLLEVKRLGILLQFSAVSRVEAVPRDEDSSVFGFARDGLGRQVEVAFP